jgi:hypothetical protein
MKRRGSQCVDPAERYAAIPALIKDGALEVVSVKASANLESLFLAPSSAERFSR